MRSDSCFKIIDILKPPCLNQQAGLLHRYSQAVIFPNDTILQVKEIILKISDIQGVSKNRGNKDFEMFYASSFILMSSQERYSSPLRIEISPVVLYIISFHSSLFKLGFELRFYFISNLWAAPSPKSWQLSKLFLAIDLMVSFQKWTMILSIYFLGGRMNFSQEMFILRSYPDAVYPSSSIPLNL